MRIKLMGLTLAVCAISACEAVGPNFQRPQISLSESFAKSPASALRQAADDEWWTALNDPVLNKLMSRALAQGLTVQAARAQILEARAVLRGSGPSADLTGDLTLNVDHDSRFGSNSSTDNSASAAFSPSFLVDLFGERRRITEQAQALVNAAVFDEAAARLALQLEVATTYFDLRFFQRSEVLRRRSIAQRAELVNILKQRADSQTVTKFELSRSQAELDLERALLPATRTGINANAFALATLLSEPADRILKEVARKRAKQPVPKRGFAAGLPAGLLQNRPDIRAAEAQLAAATAEVGIFEAQLYPSLTIGGTLSANTSTGINVGAGLNLPILDRAVRKSSRDASKARALQADINWRQTVLASIEEVQTNLVSIGNIDSQLQSLERANRTYVDAVRLTREAFELGAVTFNEIIESENTLTLAEISLADAKRDYASTWAQLNVAIGQGWHVTP